TLPSFVTFVTFLGPLLGIALGFDAINSERNKGTLTRLMSQPIPRDYVLNAKFVAAILVNIVLFFTLGLLVMAFGILILGIPPTWEEFLRVVVLYVYALSISLFGSTSAFCFQFALNKRRHRHYRGLGFGSFSVCFIR